LHGKLRQIIQANDRHPGPSVLSMKYDWDVVASIFDCLVECVVESKTLATLDFKVQAGNINDNIGGFVTTLELAAATSVNIEKTLEFCRGLAFATFSFIAR